MSDPIEQQTARIRELEHELCIVYRQLERYQGRELDDILDRRRAAIQFYREEYERTHGAPPTYCRGNSDEGQDVVDSSVKTGGGQAVNGDEL